MSRRNIDQRRKERILEEINQVYDEAYELGYQSGRRQNEDIAYTGDIIAQALKTLKGLTEDSANIDIVMCKNCKYYTPLDSNHIFDCEWGLSVFEDNFCSHGVRKESEEE